MCVTVFVCDTVCACFDVGFELTVAMFVETVVVCVYRVVCECVRCVGAICVCKCVAVCEMVAICCCRVVFFQ